MIMMKKRIAVFIFSLLLMASCKDNDSKAESVEMEDNAEEQYMSVGKEIQNDDALTAERMAEHYNNMSVGDTINSKMVGKVDEVCQAKGCWMKMDLENGEQVMVKFKDYGFFMPKDISGKEVIVNGVAYVEEMPVDEQKHYAEDAGGSDEEIAEITSPKKTYAFIADGVLIKK